MSQTPTVEQLTIGRYGLHGLAWVTLLSVLLLLCSGGIVTSKGVGMAVPDWPTTYGYNMFLFPVSKWVGGIFWEHSHRLIASGVGFLTVLLCIWLFISEPRAWVKTLGIVAVGAVIVQGVLGGLRVTLYKNEIGIFHGILAQLFLCLIGTIVIVTSPWFVRWWSQPGGKLGTVQPALWRFVLPLGIVIALFVQLALGAAMRHAHRGLSIPDFPLAYGVLLPDTSAAQMEKINLQRAEAGMPSTTGALIWLQMKHRLLAVGIVGATGWFVFLAWRSGDRTLLRAAMLWLLMLGAQFFLGAWTVWSGKSPYVTTAHVFLGALCLLWGYLLVFYRFCERHKTLQGTYITPVISGVNAERVEIA